jgi:hypothetical protein
MEPLRIIIEDLRGDSRNLINIKNYISRQVQNQTHILPELLEKACLREFGVDKCFSTKIIGHI